MTRDEIFAECKGMLGAVPGWLEQMPDGVLQQNWDALKFVMGDSALSGRDKALVSMGAAIAGSCQY